MSGYVVLDTNYWVHKTLLLRTSVSRSLVFNVAQSGFKIGLPEVIEREVIKQVGKRGTSIAAKVGEGLERLSLLMNRVYELPLPTDGQLRCAAETRFGELVDIIERIPFTFEQASAALSRTIEDIPPASEGDYGFKDSAIWEAILGLLAQEPVHFLTCDKVFFDGGDFNKELRPELAAEVPEEKSFTLYSKLSDLLLNLRVVAPSVDEEAALAAIEDAAMPQIQDVLSDHSSAVGPLDESSTLVLSLTEDHSRLAASFTLVHSTIVPPLYDDVEFQTAEGLTTTVGSCTVNADTLAVSDLILESVRIVDSDDQRRGGVVWLGPSLSKSVTQRAARYR